MMRTSSSTSSLDRSMTGELVIDTDKETTSSSGFDEMYPLSPKTRAVGKRAGWGRQVRARVSKEQQQQREKKRTGIVTSPDRSSSSKHYQYQYQYQYRYRSGGGGASGCDLTTTTTTTTTTTMTTTTTTGETPTPTPTTTTTTSTTTTREQGRLHRVVVGGEFLFCLKKIKKKKKKIKCGSAESRGLLFRRGWVICCCCYSFLFHDFRRLNI